LTRPVFGQGLPQLRNFDPQDGDQVLIDPSFYPSDDIEDFNTYAGLVVHIPSGQSLALISDVSKDGKDLPWSGLSSSPLAGFYRYATKDEVRISLSMAGALGIELVEIGDAGNLPDQNGYGAVAYPFSIGRTEVTVSQYANFLNAVARFIPPDDLNYAHIESLWNRDMRGGKSKAGPQIERIEQSKGVYSYQVFDGASDQAIANVSWFQAARFTNWLHNGMPSSTAPTLDPGTETGAYLLNGQLSGIFNRELGAKFWIPTEDEWYKAAYYDPTKEGQPYWRYPTSSDTLPALDRSNISEATNAANYNAITFDELKLLDVGSFPQSKSYYGTLDQAGGLWEWNDSITLNAAGIANSRGVRGGSWSLGLLNPGKEVRRDYTPDETDDDTGFRIASSEPGLQLESVRAPLSPGSSLQPNTPHTYAKPQPFWGSRKPNHPDAELALARVGDPANPVDAATGFGAVQYTFNIGKYETTVAEFALFLNSVATDPNAPQYILDLYQADMADPSEDPGKLIAQVEINGRYRYDVAEGRDRLPIGWVNWFAAARYANWLHNGAGLGADTETGAYSLNGASTGVFYRNPTARYWIPSEDEWYKAAYFDPTNTPSLYWKYATRSNKLPDDAPGMFDAVNAANYNSQRAEGDVYVPVGSYVNSASFYGAYDMSGNVWEWNDAVIETPDPKAGKPDSRGVRGGSYSQGILAVENSTRRDYPTGYRLESGYLAYTDDDTGFRIASAVNLSNVGGQSAAWNADMIPGTIPQSVDFLKTLQLSVARTDQHPGRGGTGVDFGFRSVGDEARAELWLINNAAPADQRSLTVDRLFDDSRASGWRGSEYASMGTTVASQSLIPVGRWEPVARVGGKTLVAEAVEIVGNTLTATFAGGVQARYSTGSTGVSAFSAGTGDIVVTVQRLGLFDNALAFYECDPITGAIQFEGELLQPGDPSYLAASLSLARAQNLFLSSAQLPGYGDEAVYADLPLAPGTSYGILLLPRNETAKIVSSFSKANRNDWVAMVGMSDDIRGTVFAIEDQMPGRADRDYNDLIVSFTALDFSLG
jgi:formylglycine-generating enzyme required for sulfatase activity